MKIDKDIQIPEQDCRTGKSKYPWPDMEVGDSVFFEFDYFNGITKQQASAHAYGRTHGKKFAARKVQGGQRIWRIA